MAGILETDTIVHMAVLVKDIEESVKQYAEFFGMDVPHTSESDSPETSEMIYRGKPAKGRCKQATFNFGFFAIELIQPDNNPSAWREALDEKGEGFHHICFRVKDMPEKVKILKDKGYPEIMSGKWGGKNPGRYAYIDTTRDLKLIIEPTEYISQNTGGKA
jgi:catechol 2,3-dioxygenase-like lactoylglutathione lyase family enzyme